MTLYCIYTPPAHPGVFPLHYFPPFSMSACPTYVRCPCQGFISFHVFYPYLHFHLPCFFVNYPYLFRPPLHIKHAMPSLKKHTISLSFPPITSLFIPPQKSDIPASRTSKPKTRGFGKSSLNRSKSGLE